MNSGDLVSSLQRLGYELTLDRANIHFGYAGAGDPPEQAAALLEKVRKRKAEVLDYLQLIETPLDKLKEPLLIESFLPGCERIYLVANRAQAQGVEMAGGIPYLPSEVRAMLALSRGMSEKGLERFFGQDS